MLIPDVSFGIVKSQTVLQCLIPDVFRGSLSQEVEELIPDILWEWSNVIQDSR